MKEKLGISILSFAYGHANVYCQVIQDFEDAQLIAARDDNADRGGAACERFGIPPRRTDRIVRCDGQGDPGTPPRPFTEQTVCAEDGRLAVEMVLAAYQSAQTGQRIRLF